MAASALIALLLAAQAAGEKLAHVDQQGKLFCFANDRTLRETADGQYELTMFVKLPGDFATAIYPGGKPLFGPSGSFIPHIYTGYKARFTREGKPAAPPRPFSLAAGTGRFSAPRLEPIESLRLKIEAGAATQFPEMPLEEVAYGIAVPLGKITTAQHKDRDSEVVVGEATLRGLVQVAESGKPKVLLLQDGKEVARFPISTEGLQAKAREALSWTTKTAEAMTARKACPAG